MRPAMPGRANMVSDICQLMISDKGAAIATEKAIPRLNAAVVRAFMIVISFGWNHCISKGPVAVSINANPRPIVDRSKSKVTKLGARTEKDNIPTEAHPITKDLRSPTRDTSMPPGRPKAAAAKRGKAIKRPAAVRFISYSSMANGRIGEAESILRPTLKCAAKSNAAITNLCVLLPKPGGTGLWLIS